MGGAASEVPATPVPERVVEWLSTELGDGGPYEMRPLPGGNSNETWDVRSRGGRWILRRPPPHLIDASAHSMRREHEVLVALAGAGAPVPRPLALFDDPAAGGSALLMEAIDGVSLTEELPAGLPSAGSELGGHRHQVVDALARVHLVDWVDAGLGGFGRPDGFLERQVPRWRSQRERNRTRELPYFDEVGCWLEAHVPPAQPPAVLHGDFHLDNCLMSTGRPIRLRAVIDWEMATIGDPLVDLGLFLAFWGTDRPASPATPRIQAVSRVAGSPSRGELAAGYGAITGRSVARHGLVHGTGVLEAGGDRRGRLRAAGRGKARLGVRTGARPGRPGVAPRGRRCSLDSARPIAPHGAPGVSGRGPTRSNSSEPPSSRIARSSTASQSSS